MNRFAPALLAAVLLLPWSVAGAREAAERFTLDAREVELSDVIRLLGARAGRNLVADASVKPQKITLRLRDVTFEEALATLVSAYALQTHRDGRVVIVGDAASMNRRYPDDSGAAGTQTRVFTLHRAHPDELVAPLQSALPPGTVVVGDKRTGVLVVTGSASTVARAQQLVATFDGPSPSGDAAHGESIALRNLRAGEAVKTLRSAVPDALLLAEERGNAIVVAGSPDARAAVRALIKELDAPGRQVMFEVRVADVQPINDQTNVGVQFGGAGYGAGALGQFAYALTKSSLVVNAQIDALVQRGKASILAQPRIATLNNREANLLVGEQYPVVTVNQQTGFPSVQTIDVGVRLRLTPTIGADGSITAELHPEYSQIIGFNSSFPIVANRKVDATLRVRDGETIVLGGLFQDVDSETITKFPLLGDLPVLGAFFRNRASSHTKDEVVFFITPHVLPGEGRD